MHTSALKGDFVFFLANESLMKNVRKKGDDFMIIW